MEPKNHSDILIIGGGLAGLSTALHLSGKGLKISIIEKNSYPNHKVCGEYVSNEVLPYLISLGIDPFKAGAKAISKFQLTDISGGSIESRLPLGGFGISRYCFDALFYDLLKNKVDFIFDTAEKIEFREDQFLVNTQRQGIFTAQIVVGAFGKRSNLDAFLERKFMLQPSPWLAVKAHYNYEFPENTVALHNFKGGYCGLSTTESNVVNACYLTTFESFKKYGNIDDFQKRELSKNPFLDQFFKEAVPVFKKPITISQIAFQNKSPIENHIFMVGDSAGLIHPLCGNGMAMAINSARIFSEIVLDQFQKEKFNRNEMELEYTKKWHSEFGTRMRTGAMIQKVLLHPLASKIGFKLAKTFPVILPKIIKKTHGTQP
jgi:flavin-dependent dehydrogenase